MSIFESFFLQNRRGAIDAKLWVSWPLSLRLEDIDDIYQALCDSFSVEEVRWFANGREVWMPQPQGYPNLPSQFLPSAVRTRGLKSIAFVAKETVWVHLGPRLPYAYSLSTESDAISVLWKVQTILKKAKWGFGNFLFRTWGTAIAVTGATVSAAYVFGSSTTAAARDVSVALLVGALAVFLLAALIVGVFRRIRIDVRYPGEKGGAFSRWLGGTATAIIVTVIGTLIATAVWSYLAGGK